MEIVVTEKVQKLVKLNLPTFRKDSRGLIGILENESILIVREDLLSTFAPNSYCHSDYVNDAIKMEEITEGEFFAQCNKVLNKFKTLMPATS